MRSFTHAFIGYVLALLLLGTSPVGAGTGVHQNQLLDALVPHVHFVDGKPVEKTGAPTVARSGPALGAGAGAAASASGLAIVSPLPAGATELHNPSERWSAVAEDDARPRGLSEAPPDPPPTA